MEIGDRDSPFPQKCNPTYWPELAPACAGATKCEFSESFLISPAGGARRGSIFISYLLLANGKAEKI